MTEKTVIIQGLGKVKGKDLFKALELGGMQDL